MLGAAISSFLAGAAFGVPLSTERISAFITLPLGPVPTILSALIPSICAIRAASGEILTLELSLYSNTSSLWIRPLDPVPWTLDKSIPFLRAYALAAGVARIPE